MSLMAHSEDIYAGFYFQEFFRLRLCCPDSIQSRVLFYRSRLREGGHIGIWISDLRNDKSNHLNITCLLRPEILSFCSENFRTGD